MKYLIKYLPIVIVTLCTLIALFPLMQSGLYSMHDDEQIARLYDLHQSLSSLHIPPRIIPNLGFGYGYPFFNFYPPFAYYTGEFFHLFGFSYIVSTKLMLVSIFVLSSIFMYLFTKIFFGRIGAVVASVAYTYASYRAVDIYVRGAFAEASAFIFIPLIFYTLCKLSEKQRWLYVVIGSLGLGGLILSHNLIAFMTIPFVGTWFLYLLVKVKRKILFTKLAALSMALGFGLTAYFWLPSYLEREFTLINILTSELANYSLHFVCVHQLWDSPWGYGGSILGCYDGISFEIGKIQLLSSFAAFIIASYLFVKKKKNLAIVPTIVFFVFLVICIFLMSKFSKLVWDSLPPLWYIQFPWRYLLIASFISAFLTGGFIGFIKSRTVRIILGVLIIGLIVGMGANRFTPQRYINEGDEKYIDKKVIRWDTSSLAYEYVPKGIQTIKTDIGTTRVDINENEIATSSSEVISGEMKVEEILDLPHSKRFRVTVATPGVFQINTYSFPGWNIKVNNNNVRFTDNNKLKLMQISLGNGENIVEANFLDTPTRITGNVISVISIILLVGISFWSIYRKKR